VALRRALGVEVQQAPPVLEFPSGGAVRAAVLAGAGPAAMSRLAVADDLAAGRLREIAVSQIDLRRDLWAIWLGGSTQPAGAIKSLLTHIGCRTEELNGHASRRRSGSGPQSGS
jgi:DNA-binding transcriptional LysR family regulator